MRMTSRVTSSGGTVQADEAGPCADEGVSTVPGLTEISDIGCDLGFRDYSVVVGFGFDGRNVPCLTVAPAVVVRSRRRRPRPGSGRRPPFRNGRAQRRAYRAQRRPSGSEAEIRAPPAKERIHVLHDQLRWDGGRARRFGRPRQAWRRFRARWGMSRGTSSGERSGGTDCARVDFLAAANGIDHLSEVVARLARPGSEVSPRDLKYAVLYVQAAAEVLVDQPSRGARHPWVRGCPGR